MEKEVPGDSVFVAIPNKNGLKHLSYSIPSLQDSTYPNYRAILVDDGSTDNSLDFIKHHHAWVKVLKNNRSKGFAGAVNTGIEYALDQNADYIAIFNSDIKVAPNWIELALRVFEKRSDIGIVGYTEVSRESQGDLNSARNLEELDFHKVQNPSGCLFICPSLVFRKIGLFDEGYFMYGEDNDLFFRIRKAGFVFFQINTPVWHYGQGSSGKQAFLVSWLAYRNAMRFAIKNLGIIGTFRQLLSLLNQGCNVFLPKRDNDNNWQRLRRYNVFVNSLLIVGSCFWNIAHIAQTLKSRQHTERFPSNMSLQDI